MVDFDLTNQKFIDYIGKAGPREFTALFKNFEYGDSYNLDFLISEAKKSYPTYLNLCIYYDGYYDESCCKININYTESEEDFYSRYWNAFIKKEKITASRLARKMLKSQRLQSMQDEYGPMT